MTYHPNVRVFAIVGPGAHDIVKYLTETGYPKVSKNDIGSQVEHLANAGQHRIVTDEIRDFDSYKTLRHTLPGESVVLAVAEKDAIKHFKALKPTLSRNWNELEALRETDLILLADDYIEHSDDIHQLMAHVHEKIEKHIPKR